MTRPDGDAADAGGAGPRGAPARVDQLEAPPGAVTVRKWLMGAACAAMLAAAPQSAGAFEDGHQLLEWATRETDTFQYPLYVGYVYGVAGTMTMYETLCFKGSLFPSPKDLSDIVRIWLHLNPDKLDSPGHWLVVRALMDRFPCD